MTEIDVKKLSPTEAASLIINLPCSKSYFSPGDHFCIDARHKAGVEPENVGTGPDTIAEADSSQPFAVVCQNCPVLFTALAKTTAHYIKAIPVRENL